MSDNTEALANALRNARDEEIARLFVLVFGIAVERHPELLRAALKHVLDLPVIEETLKNLKADIERTWQKGNQASAGIGQLAARLNRAGQLMKELEIQVASLKAAQPVNGQPQKVTK